MRKQYNFPGKSRIRGTCIQKDPQNDPPPHTDHKNDDFDLKFLRNSSIQDRRSKPQKKSQIWFFIEKIFFENEKKNEKMDFEKYFCSFSKNIYFFQRKKKLRFFFG